MVGGVAALVGAKILGARIGKYDKDGKPKAILGHSITLAALGVFILWFAWLDVYKRQVRRGRNRVAPLGNHTRARNVSHNFLARQMPADYRFCTL